MLGITRRAAVLGAAADERRTCSKSLQKKLWPLGASSPGMWIDPPYTASMFSTSAGTTAISAIGTVLDTSNPAGLVLDRKGGLALDAMGAVGAEFLPVMGNSTSYPFDTFSGSAGGFDGATLTAKIGGAVSTNTLSVTANLLYRLTLNVVSASRDLSIRLVTDRTGASGSALSGMYNVPGVGPKTIFIQATGTGAAYLQCNNGGSAIASYSVTGISVREIPGIHLSQATATSRPVASARVNLLTYSEDFSNAAWVKQNVTITTNTDGVADTITNDATLGEHRVYQFASGDSHGLSAKAGTTPFMSISTGTTSVYATFNLSLGTVLANAGCTPSIDLDSDGFWRCKLEAGSEASAYQMVHIGETQAQALPGASYSGTGKTIVVKSAQLNLGSTALPYQRIGAASDYDASAGPTYCDLDGTDDGWLSATFTANTAFTAGMDALIAIRRDSTANAVCGLYQSVADANKVFGIAESGSGSGCVGSGAGTPTVLVDGTQLTGGTAVTRGTLHTALTPGDWHILEFRNLDLSTWTAIGFGRYTSYVLNGGYGGHKVFSSGQDANRDLARAQMAAYFGVTLP